MFERSALMASYAMLDLCFSPFSSLHLRLNLPLFVQQYRGRGNGFIPIAEYGLEFTKDSKEGKKRVPVRLLYSGKNHYDLLIWNGHMKYVPTKHQSTGSHRPFNGTYINSRFLSMVAFFDPAMFLWCYNCCFIDLTEIIVMGILGIWRFGARISTNLMIASHDLTLRCLHGVEASAVLAVAVIWLASCRGVVDCVSGWCRAE